MSLLILRRSITQFRKKYGLLRLPVTGGQRIGATSNLWEANIGVPDVFGVGFTQTSGDYDASVVRCYGVLRNGWDGAQRRINETYSRGSADGSTGFFFELQDSTATVDTSERSTRYKNTYIGSEWFASCTYSEEFAYFSGTATGFYVHTWSGAVIESISLGVQGKTAGLGIEITNMNYSFSAYGADVKF